MIVALARKTLIYEWRRFLPAALAVAFSGLLLLMQAALIFGIFNSASVYIRASQGDLWVGYPGTQSIELGRPISSETEMLLRMDSNVAQVEPFQWLDGDWRGPASRGGVSVFISGIDPRADGLMFASVLRGELRQRLLEPGGVIVDRADLDKLGLNVGASATINRQHVRIVGVASGLRALGGVNIVTSLATARRLDSDTTASGKVAYYVVRLHDPISAEATRIRLTSEVGTKRFAVWTRDEFAQRAVRYWMFETGAGLGFLFLAVVVFLVGAVITSQTLMSAVAGSVREYATLHALGVSFRRLRNVVLEQASWVGTTGLLIGGALSALIIALARQQDVPVDLDALTVLACGVLVMGIALVSGLMAVRALRHADPATLLR
jgi:putative ABC transport system permease protein